jgi:hypothetical protein
MSSPDDSKPKANTKRNYLPCSWCKVRLVYQETETGVCNLCKRPLLTDVEPSSIVVPELIERQPSRNETSGAPQPIDLVESNLTTKESPSQPESSEEPIDLALLFTSSKLTLESPRFLLESSVRPPFFDKQSEERRRQLEEWGRKLEEVGKQFEEERKAREEKERRAREARLAEREKQRLQSEEGARDFAGNLLFVAFLLVLVFFWNIGQCILSSFRF